MTDAEHTTAYRESLNAAPAVMVVPGAGIGTAIAVHAAGSDADPDDNGAGKPPPGTAA